jgi:Sperm-tail PG-rich repeat
MKHHNMENSSFRQAGKEIFGKVYKGSVVDAYNRLTQPSIPTKNEESLKASNKKEGFGSSANRFIDKKIKLPGPGQYSDSVFENPSLSKKGFGGLTNSAPRFKKFQYVNSVPGPGSYENKPSTSQGFTISLGKVSSLKDHPVYPAPGQYDPLFPSSNKQTTSMFKSKSRRLEVPDKVSPAPWQYNPSYSLTRSTSTALSSAFKMPANARRHQINLYDPHASIPVGVTPGPGEYYTSLKNDQPRPSSMFASTEKDRFGQPVKPRVTEVMPGPGHYAKPDAISKVPVSGAVFMSESERKCFTTEKKPPGPAFYKPMLQPKKKSFHLKPNNIWGYIFRASFNLLRFSILKSSCLLLLLYFFFHILNKLAFFVSFTAPIAIKKCDVFRTPVFFFFKCERSVFDILLRTKMKFQFLNKSSW